jgi:hypothetical protein
VDLRSQIIQRVWGLISGGVIAREGSRPRHIVRWAVLPSECECSSGVVPVTLDTRGLVPAGVNTQDVCINCLSGVSNCHAFGEEVSCLEAYLSS